MTNNKNLLYCLLIGCLEIMTTQYVYPARKSISRYSYTVYKNKKVDSNPNWIEEYTDYKKCILACYNKKDECKSIEAVIVDENILKCRFFNVESPKITQADGYIYISSKPPNCSLSCNLTSNPCGRCKCKPSCAARNRWQYVCNCTLEAGPAKTCQDHYNNGFTKTGIFQIRPNGSTFQTICKMEKVRLQNQKNAVDNMNERVVKKNNLIATLPLLQKTYSIFFKFILRSTSDVRNIIHLTIDNNNGQYGERNPGVWVFPDTFYICSAISGNSDACTQTKLPPLNIWFSMHISQTQINGVYSYAIDLNSEKVFSTINKLPQSFQNVKIYNGDPWHNPADVSIKDLKIISGNGNFVNYQEYFLTKGNLVAILPYLEKIYVVSFRLKPVEFINEFHSVIHLTIQGNDENYGSRIPGIWVYDKRLHCGSAVSGDQNHVFLTEPLMLNVWYDIQIIQTQRNRVYHFAAYLNRKLVQTVKNTMPQSFPNVKVYTADPWYDAQRGYIKDLKILNGFDLVDEVDEKELIQDNLIALLTLLEKTYTVSFSLKPRSYSFGWKNVIHLTFDSVSFQYEVGALAVSFYNDGSGRLFVSSVVNGNNSYSILTPPLPLNVWSCIKISQIINNGVYIFEINLNGVTVHSIENRIPQLFNNVFVYTADPWYDAQDGSIKGLKITNCDFGVWIPMLTRFASWESSFWNRSYEDYVNGFGLVNQQWIGLKNLNQLTNSFYTDMRVDYFLSSKIAFSTMYYNVVVGSSSNDYKFNYDEYDSRGSSEPDLFNANGTKFNICNNWWTTSCSETSPTTTDYISYGTENLYSIEFFLRTNEIKV